MREILFRGKHATIGNWEYGYYVFVPNWHGKEKHYIQTLDDDRDLGLIHSVSPETVGQFTGLTDKNGVKVFEGDILKIAKKSDSLGTYYYPPVEYPVNVFVRWDLCAWLWEVRGKEGPYYIGFPEAWCHYECKVIGNIYENPELLEGEDA